MYTVILTCDAELKYVGTIDENDLESSWFPIPEVIWAIYRTSKSVIL